MNFSRPLTSLSGLIGLLALVSTLPLTGAMLYGTTELSRWAAQDASDHATVNFAFVGELLSERLRQQARIASLLAELAGHTDLARGVCPKGLTSSAMRDKTTQRFIATDAAGMAVCTDGTPSPRMSLADRPYFHEARIAPDAVVARPVVSRLSGRPVIPVVAAIRGPQGGFGGIVDVGIDLTEWLTEISRLLPMVKARLTLWSSDGVLLARAPDPEGLAGRHMPASELFRALPAIERGATLEPVMGLDNVESLYAAIGLEVGGERLWLAVGRESEMVLAPARRIFWRTAAATGLVAIVTLALALALVELALRRPIGQMTNALEAGRPLSPDLAVRELARLAEAVAATRAPVGRGERA